MLVYQRIYLVLVQKSEPYTWTIHESWKSRVFVNPQVDHPIERDHLWQALMMELQTLQPWKLPIFRGSTTSKPNWWQDLQYVNLRAILASSSGI